MKSEPGDAAPNALPIAFELGIVFPVLPICMIAGSRLSYS